MYDKICHLIGSQFRSYYPDFIRYLGITHNINRFSYLSIVYAAEWLFIDKRQ